MSIDIALHLNTRVPVRLDAAKLGRHGAILAQSGSGKSFMLGRLIEELLLKTKARLLILDPNSDFIRLPNPDTSAFSDPKLAPWFFPGESAAQFGTAWKACQVAVASNNNLEGARGIKIDWGGLSEYEMASVMKLDLSSESDLYWCLFLASEIAKETWDDEDEVYDFDHFREQSDTVVNYLLTNRGPKLLRENPLAQTLRSTLNKQVTLRFRALVSSLADFSIWRSTGDGERDICTWVTNPESEHRALVVDLQSLSNEDERIAVTTRILSTIWDRARKDLWEATRDFDKDDLRVPLFIVVDEAHNLIPAVKDDPGIERLCAQMVRIAAEGRKFGLHLLVATQRPRKIDSNVLSECDNLFLMKMTNDSDVKYACELFGFLTNAMVAQAKQLRVGEMLLAGSVFTTSEAIHSAPRRTIQGGKGISEQYWAVPYGTSEELSVPQAKRVRCKSR